eukprot:TRINITY_DN7924_c0_g1_i1.p1 TRINITY_DN7924_c0_g1~~TRINITY_DN7924_c0_g1_i1.p1  ORF type:complete len:572 (-),score=102.21 TRINITY_DN7924_c0_g1_i1:90-1805(-)
MGPPRKGRAHVRARQGVHRLISLGLVCLLLALVAWAGALGSAFREDVVDFDSAGSDPTLRRLLPTSGGSNLLTADPLIDSPIATAKNKYWVVVHIIVIGYMLLGMNTVCDLYFAGSLDQMVNSWGIKPDVAGATFMAAGGSAPELFTSLIGALTETDVGFSTIVGSAVFNVLFVIGCCGFAAKQPIKLSWWPLFRDCLYYVFGLSLLSAFAKTGNSIQLWEAIMLFLVYCGYCTIMYFNETLEAAFAKSPQSDQQAPAVNQWVVPDTGSTEHAASNGNDIGDGQVHHIHKTQPKFQRSNTANGGLSSKVAPAVEGSAEAVGKPTEPGESESENEERIIEVPDSKPEEMPDIKGEEAEEEEAEEDDIAALLDRPDSPAAQVIWCLSLPVYVPLYYLIPRPENRFMACFVVSLSFIAGLSLVLVYAVEVLGEVLRIHIVVMGFTLLAAGTSIPDLVSSVAVARAGEGDMAVSSSIGSNIFDICVGLPIPWIIKIGFVEMAGRGEQGYVVNIISDYIVLYVLILVAMVVSVVCSIHFLGWVLNRPLGLMMAFLYTVFLVVVLSIELTQPAAIKF